MHTWPGCPLCLAELAPSFCVPILCQLVDRPAQWRRLGLRLFWDLHGPVSSIVEPSRRRAVTAPVFNARALARLTLYKLMQFADAALKLEGAAAWLGDRDDLSSMREIVEGLITAEQNADLSGAFFTSPINWSYYKLHEQKLVKSGVKNGCHFFFKLLSWGILIKFCGIRFRSSFSLISWGTPAYAVGSRTARTSSTVCLTNELERSCPSGCVGTLWVFFRMRRVSTRFLKLGEMTPCGIVLTTHT